MRLLRWRAARSTFLCPSGLNAITIGYHVRLQRGDHLWSPIAATDRRGSFCDKVLKRFGVETTYYDPLIGEDIATHFRPNTKAVFAKARAR